MFCLIFYDSVIKQYLSLSLIVSAQQVCQQQIFYSQKMQKSYKFKYESSKKALEAINKFNYYVQEIVPTHFLAIPTNSKNNSSILNYAQGPNNLIYFWAHHKTPGAILVNEQSILHSIKSTHLTKMNADDQILKVNQKTYQRLSILAGSMISSKWVASEVIEFVLKAGQFRGGKKIPYQLYIIHHCQNEPAEKRKMLKWVHFVEKYTFSDQDTNYEAFSAAQIEKAVFGLYSNLTTFDSFISSYFKIESLQGQLMKYESSIKEKIKESEDPAFSSEHKLINLIPNQYLKIFYSLKKQFGEENEQLICRFMIGREFKIEQVRKGVKQYIEFVKNLDETYTWEDFQEFHKMKIFHYLGEDYQGRPVILNIAKNVLVDEMDVQKYCIYYMYFLEVYIAKKIRGLVTQINIIADVSDIGPKNFKLAITKRNIDDGKRYCVERQFKFFAVNISAFANFCYRFIKPLLPKKTAQRIYVGGNDVNEIRENLQKDMSVDVIPTYLGGRNPII